MIVLFSDSVLFIYLLLVWPYLLYCILAGFQIIRGRQNSILLHYQLLFWLLKLIRGDEYMRRRRNRYINSSELKRDGWFAFIAGILMFPATTIYIFDYLSRISR